MSGTSRFAAPFAVRLRDDVRRHDRGALLIGGSPLRVIRLSDRAQAAMVDSQVVAGDPIGDVLAAQLLHGNLADPLPSPLHQASFEELTVVIPVRDRAEQLERCLSSLAPLACIVVDDASIDPRVVHDVVERHGARLVPLAHNAGPAGARNAGLREVTTPLVAFVDSDVTADPATLLGLTAHFADDRVAMVGPRIRGVVRSRRPRLVERHDARASSLDMGGEPASVRSGSRVGWLPSACLVARTDRLGSGFEPRLRVGEDVDLVWRLIEAGQTVRYDPGLAVGHDVRSSLTEWLGRKFAYGTSGALLAARHGNRVAPAELSLPMGVAAALILARHATALPVTIGVVVHGTITIGRRLPQPASRTAISLPLVVQGVASAVRQESALALRHWWPLAMLGGLASRSVRRFLVTALTVDLCVSLQEYPGLGPWSHLVLRRLDDLGYGAGLWWGALLAGSPGCLLVRVPERGRASDRGRLSR